MGSWKQGNNCPLVDCRNHCYNQVAAKKLRAFICQWLILFGVGWCFVIFSFGSIFQHIVGWTKWASNAQDRASVINDSLAVCKPIVTSNIFISHGLLQWRVYTKQTQENIQLKPIWPYLVTQMSNCNSPSLTWMFNTTLLQMWVVERNKVYQSKL